MGERPKGQTNIIDILYYIKAIWVLLKHFSSLIVSVLLTIKYWVEDTSLDRNNINLKSYIRIYLYFIFSFQILHTPRRGNVLMNWKISDPSYIRPFHGSTRWSDTSQCSEKVKLKIKFSALFLFLMNFSDI